MEFKAMYSTRLSLRLFSLLLLGVAAACGSESGMGSRAQGALWAETVQPSPLGSYFGAATVDVSGNLYVVSSVSGNGDLGLGNGVTVTVAGRTVFLARYDSGGKAMWTQSLAGDANDYPSFAAVTSDASGNAYVVGCVQSQAGVVNIGAGVTVDVPNSECNAAVFKYSSSGSPLWARTLAASPASSGFNSVAVDSNGNIYAAGSIGAAGKYDFGNNVTVTSTADPFSAIVAASCIVLVKYDASGTPLWAQTATTGTNESGFAAVAVDSAGDVYAAGSITTGQTYDFGNGVMLLNEAGISRTPAGEEGASLLLAKYSASGTALWAQTTVAGADSSNYTSIAIDFDGNTYAAGAVGGTGIFDFGNNVTTQGIADPSVFYGTASPSSFILVKYAPSGAAVWAHTVSYVESSGQGTVAVDTLGNPFIAATRLMKYNASGDLQWRSIAGGSGDAQYSTLAIGPSNTVYALGGIAGSVDLGNNVTLSGTTGDTFYGWSALLAAY